VRCLDDEELLALLEYRLPHDKAVRAQEHVDSCDDCRALVADLIGGATRRGHSEAAVAVAPALLPRGASVSRYVVVEPLGRGGMGVVYRARDPELDREIAVKLVRTDLGGDRQLRQRLIREAQALARLTHGNVVTVHDTGSFGADVFIAMELVDGGTLADWLRAAPRRPEEIVAQFVRAGRGLEAAHAAGLVHRDFKPDNVLVGRDGRVRVTDFGLALPTDGADPPDGTATPLERAIDRLTRTGAHVGTPAYMAPEQMKGEPTDARADLFSFSVALYEALYGERPFAGDSLQATLAAIVADRVERAPPGSAVSPALRRVLLRGLRGAPAARYQSMSELLEALTAAARPRRRRLIISAALAVSVLAVSAVGLGRHELGRRRAVVSAGASCRRPATPDARSAVAVDRRGGDGGDGYCAYTSLTAALRAVAPAAGQRVTIRVAKGTYDAAGGEVFPLVVRGPIDIIGAGPETIVRGAGSDDHRQAGGAIATVHPATFVVGESEARVRLSQLAVMGDRGDRLESYSVGIFCDRGNAQPAGTPQPEPNVVVDHVTIGRGYEIGILVSNSRQSGCNLSLTSSRMSELMCGVWIVGCGTGPGEGHAWMPVAAQIGAPAQGNLFERFLRDNTNVPGAAVRMWDCSAQLIMQGNTARDTLMGLDLAQHDGLPRVIVADNTFANLHGAGVRAGAYAVIDELRDNTFRWIGDAPSNGLEAGALQLREHSQLKRARGNHLVANAAGVIISGDAITPRRIIDFGRDDDKGNNSFSCNSALNDRGRGFDVLVDVARGSTAPLGFAGNQWDRSPPGRGDLASAPNGTDLVLRRGTAPTVITDGSSIVAGTSWGGRRQ
jgi:hypothetical protein